MRDTLNDTYDSGRDWVDKYIFYFCLIDILFLPYAFFMAISYSFFALIPWLFMRYRQLLKTNGEFQWFLLFSCLVVVSSVVGGVMNGVMAENLSRGIQIIQILGYYFLFYDYLGKHSVNLKPFLLAFVVFVFVMCLLYNIDKSIYLMIARLWNPRGLSSMASLYFGLRGYRFSFLWMDPNNIAYMIVGITAFLLTNEKTSIVEKTGLLITLAFVLVSAMSTGGYLSVAIECGLLIIVGIGKQMSRLGKPILVKKTSVLSIGLLPFLVAMVNRMWQNYSQSAIAMEASKRFQSNSAESRFEIWGRIIRKADFIKYLIIGYGGVTIVGGYAQKPHNGHLYLILAFGMIAYVIFLSIMFKKRRQTPFWKYIWIVPIFIGFTVNVMIGEVKIGAIILLMVAASANRRYLSDRDGRLLEGMNNDRLD